MSYPPQDPYGRPYQQQPGPYGPQQYPYGQPYDQQNPYGYGYGPPPASNAAAVAALVANVLLLVFTCGINLFAIAGIVTAGIAVSRVNSDPVSAKNLTTASWIIFGVLVALTVLLLGIGAAVGLFSDTGSGYDDGYEV
ncbi:hypothetical protein GCM10027589_26720 [Actinocorallia lasiicapitis]